MDEPCVEYTGYRTEHGYGRTNHKGRSVGAHRVAYCNHAGIELSSIRGKVVRHTCDNPPCINPAHLVLGTQADNVRDMVERGRCNNGVMYGEDNTSAKLTAAEVMFIQKYYIKGDRVFGQRALARRFGVLHQAIRHVVTGATWATHPRA